MYTLKMIVLSILLSFSSNGWAVVQEQGSDDYPQFYDLERLEDSTGVLGVEEVARSKAWQTVGNHFSEGFSHSNFWYRVKVKNRLDSHQAPYLVLTEEFYSQADLYYFKAGAWQVEKNGLRVPVSERGVFSAFPAFKLNLPAQSEQVYYLKFNGQFGLFGAVVIESEKAFYRSTLIHQMVFSAVLVALIMLSLFTLIMHLYMKDVSFVYYGLYVLSYSVWVALYSGTITLFLPEIIHSLLQVFSPLAFLFLIKFSQSILNIKVLCPKCNSGLNVLVLLYLLSVLTIPFNVALGFGLFNIVATLTMPSLMVLSIMALRNKQAKVQPFVKLYAMGLFAFFAGMIVLSVMALGGLNYNFFTRNAPFPGSVIEFIFFAYILFLRVGFLKKERDKVSSQLAAQEAVYKKELEETVAERTVMLKSSLVREKEVVKQHESFIALISHEIRNPLGIIKSQISLLKKEREKHIDNLDLRLVAIDSTTQRIEVLFEDWLLSGQLSQRLVAPEMELVKLTEWLVTIEPIIEDSYSDHKFSFTKENVVIEADLVLLKLAFLNLVDNATKYSEKHSKVIVNVISDKDSVYISVTDNGEGIAEEAQQDIFEQYVRKNHHKTTRGTGLGLSLVKDVMQVHGGKVLLKSRIGEGSTFTLQFKIRETLNDQ